MMAMEFVRARDRSSPDPDAARRIAQACHRAGVVVLTCGSFGNVIRLLPPLVIEDALLADGLEVLSGAVDEPSSTGRPGPRSGPEQPTGRYPGVLGRVRRGCGAAAARAEASPASSRRISWSASRARS